jgi:predicted transcriptional regulator
LTILRVLWKRGPSTVREVHDVLYRKRATGYTTVLKMLQIMTEKGLVTRDKSQRSHIYKARLAREQTQRQLVRDLLRRAFGGSARQLVTLALTSERVSPEEAAELRRLIDRLERENDAK